MFKNRDHIIKLHLSGGVKTSSPGTHNTHRNTIGYVCSSLYHGELMVLLLLLFIFTATTTVHQYNGR